MSNHKSFKHAIETDPLASYRAEQIERDLGAWADKKIEFSFDPSGTHLYSTVELSRSYAKRFVDFAKAIKLLIANDQIIPATVLARALIETIAIGCLYLYDMERLIAAGDLERLTERFKRFYAGVGATDLRPINVMDGIRYLENIDTQYAQYLDGKYGVLTKKIEELGGPIEGDKNHRIAEVISAMKNYATLSEVSHPNGVGTQLVYPADVPCDENIGPAVDKFRFASLMSIWQGHHLLTALNGSADLSERYRDAFLSPNNP